jgi:predicted nucleic acid-binding protein
MRCSKTGGDVILYLDTSSLVKIYVEEEGSVDVASMVRRSRTVASSIIAYAEARTAFARRFREGAFTKPKYKSLLSTFEKDWDDYLQVKVTREVVRLAGNLADKHALRGFDALHLASAIALTKSGMPVIFSCYDDRLQKASILEKLAQPGMIPAT